MLKKKLFMLSAIASLLVVGTGVAVVSTNFDQGDLNVAATQNLGAEWRTGSEYIVTSVLQNKIKVKFENKTFEMLEPIQKIKSFSLTGNGNLSYEAGYFENGEGSKVLYANPVRFDIVDKIQFEVGKEPSFLRISGWNLPLGNDSLALSINYDCVTDSHNEYNNYPQLKEGYYLVGNEGVSRRGETWSALSGTNLSIAQDNSFSANLRGGTRFKIVWYDGKTLKWDDEDHQIKYAESKSFDAKKSGLIDNENNGDYFVTESDFFEIFLNEANKTVRIESIKSSSPSKVAYRLVGDKIGWDYNSNGRRLYRDENDGTKYIYDKISLAKDEQIQIKYWLDNSIKDFGYQKVSEAGDYKVVATINHADPSKSTLNIVKL